MKIDKTTLGIIIGTSFTLGYLSQKGLERVYNPIKEEIDSKEQEEFYEITNEVREKLQDTIFRDRLNLQLALDAFKENLTKNLHNEEEYHKVIVGIQYFLKEKSNFKNPESINHYVNVRNYVTHDIPSFDKRILDEYMVDEVLNDLKESCDISDKESLKKYYQSVSLIYTYMDIGVKINVMAIPMKQLRKKSNFKSLHGIDIYLKNRKNILDVFQINSDDIDYKMLPAIFNHLVNLSEEAQVPLKKKLEDNIEYYKKYGLHRLLLHYGNQSN